MIRAAIVGVSGYTGLELLRILLRHPEVEVTTVTSERYSGQHLSDIFPGLLCARSLICRALDTAEIPRNTDVIFTALPHDTSMRVVAELIASGKKVIDLSAAYRIRDLHTFEAFYGKHTAPQVLERAVYGLPELHRNEIRRAQLIANPGCYPICTLLALAPLFKADLIEPEGIIIDAKSGVSGAGRSVAQETLFGEVHGSLKAYKVAEHRHGPEIEQELSRVAGKSIRVTFTPHLVPMARGILSTIYVKPRTGANLAEAYEKAYKDEPFVRMLPLNQLPATGHVLGSNYAFIGFKSDLRTGRTIIVSVIDNLVKGASGQAVQNMNLIYGLDETAGLDQLPLFP